MFTLLYPESEPRSKCADNSYFYEGKENSLFKVVYFADST
jgi:hypothetical protein